MKHFVILGLPRSGTTYLQTLLNSDPRLFCRGESFDAWQIDDDGQKTTDYEAIVARDADPLAFFDERLSLTEGPQGPLAAVGLKILFQHNPRLFTEVLPARPDVALIFVHRQNKLAQFASMRHTQITGEWTRTAPGALPPKLEAHVHWVAESCNELVNKDFLLRNWLERLPNPLMCVEYREMFEEGFPARLLKHLGVPEGDDALLSPLVKQGNNVVLRRYADAATVADYFTRIGRADWLGPELPEGAGATTPDAAAG
ncbi:sulfotransferase [Tropicimonas marinistellae]|uniref:sulfotransferase n=1 Tax=Tropicimonas marinistellae TaxID=1739787 RepID=UPI00082968CC|nr:sulfotransferase [Tropicimonas marinistellae]